VLKANQLVRRAGSEKRKGEREDGYGYAFGAAVQDEVESILLKVRYVPLL